MIRLSWTLLASRRSCLRFWPIWRRWGGRKLRLLSWRIMALGNKSGILNSISTGINKRLRNLITIWCRKRWERDNNIFTYILAILRWKRRCCSIRCFTYSGCIGNTSNNTWNWNVSRSYMFELMSSTLKWHIDDVAAGFIRTSKLAGMHNTLRDWRLWLKETLKVHFFKWLFSYVDSASTGANLYCPLFDNCDIRLNIGSNLDHLDVSSNNWALRINNHIWLIKLRVWQRPIDVVEVDRVEKVGNERSANIISRLQLDSFFVTNDISYTNFVGRINRHRIFLNFHILPIYNCYRSVISGCELCKFHPAITLSRAELVVVENFCFLHYHQLEFSRAILASKWIKAIRVYIKPDENILCTRHPKEIAFSLPIIPTDSVSINLPSIVDIVDHEDLKAFNKLWNLHEQLSIISHSINWHLKPICCPFGIIISPTSIELSLITMGVIDADKSILDSFVLIN